MIITFVLASGPCFRYNNRTRSVGSVGRAHRSHRWGHWFESSTDHHRISPKSLTDLGLSFSSEATFEANLFFMASMGKK